MSASQVDRPAIYADLGVAEAWRLVQGEELIIEQLEGGRILYPDRGKPIPARPRRGCPSLAERGGHGA